MTRHSENDSPRRTRPPGLPFIKVQDARAAPAERREMLVGWAEAYEVVLYQYLDRPRKSGLRKASGVGSLAVTGGLPLAAMRAIHNQAVRKFLPRAPNSPDRRSVADLRNAIVLAAAEFFSRCIASSRRRQ